MAPSGFVSTWLPLQQEHSVGKEADFVLLRGDIHRGRMWTDADGVAGDLTMSPWQDLPAGDYTALLQLFHPGREGLPVGTLLAEDRLLLAERYQWPVERTLHVPPEAVRIQ